MACGVGFGRENLLLAEGSVILHDLLKLHAIVQGGDPVRVDVRAPDDRFFASAVDEPKEFLGCLDILLHPAHIRCEVLPQRADIDASNIGLLGYVLQIADPWDSRDVAERRVQCGFGIAQPGGQA